MPCGREGNRRSGDGSALQAQGLTEGDKHLTRQTSFTPEMDIYCTHIQTGHNNYREANYTFVVFVTNSSILLSA